MKPTAFPLCWPSQPRTKNPRRAVFQASAVSARADLLDELRKLRARAIVLSTNVPLRRDGLPYADGDPVDAGVAVYFEIAGVEQGVEHVIACDAWDRVKDNMRAIAIRIVREHLAEMGGPGDGWVYDAPYRRLAQRIERAILDDRKRGGERLKP